MKKLALALGLVVLSPSFAFAIMGKHDLSSGGGNSVRAIAGEAGGTQVCVFCHVPHVDDDANGVGTSRPLWNHALTTTNLTWLTSTTLRGSTLYTDITSARFEGARACMSCHDGTVALGSVLRLYSGGTSSATSIGIVASSKVTNERLDATSNALLNPADMDHNHPVGITGPPANKAGFTNYQAVNPNNGVWYRTSSDGNDYVQCGSCHNPHLTTNQPFLRISNAGSAICISCHDID